MIGVNLAILETVITCGALGYIDFLIAFLIDWGLTLTERQHYGLYYGLIFDKLKETIEKLENFLKKLVAENFQKNQHLDLKKETNQQSNLFDEKEAIINSDVSYDYEDIEKVIKIKNVKQNKFKQRFD